MTCRSCGVEIADKAIVCYRCGTPTEVATPTSAVRRARGWRGPALGAIALAVAAWFGAPGPAMPWVRVAAALSAGALLVLAIVRAFRPRG